MAKDPDDPHGGPLTAGEQAERDVEAKVEGLQKAASRLAGKGVGMAPRHRPNRVNIKPSASEAAFPIGDFMVPSADSVGRSTSISFSAPPSMKRSASILLQKKVFGFKTIDDVYRWAMNYGMTYLSKKSEDVEVVGVSALLQSWVDIAQVELENAEYLRAITAMEQTIRRLVSMGHLGKAETLAEQLWRSHDKVEDPYWREQYRKYAKECLDRVKVAVKRQRKRERQEREEKDRE